MRFISFVFCLLVCLTTFSQNGKITIDGDPRIDSLMIQQTKINNQKDGVSGFRIQIKNTTDIKVIGCKSIIHC